MNSPQMDINLFPFLNKQNINIIHDDKIQSEKISCFEYTSDFERRTTPELCTLNRDNIGLIDINNKTKIDINFGTAKYNGCVLDDDENITNNCKEISDKLAFNIHSMKISGHQKDEKTNDNLKVEIKCLQKKQLDDDNEQQANDESTVCAQESVIVNDWISDGVDSSTNVRSYVKKFDSNKFTNCERLQISVNDDVLKNFRIDEINTSSTWNQVKKISETNKKEVDITVVNNFVNDQTEQKPVIKYKTKGKSIKQIAHLLPMSSFKDNVCLYNGPLNSQKIDGQNIQIASSISEKCKDQEPGTWKSTSLENENTATIYLDTDTEIKSVLIDSVKEASVSVPTKVALICNDTQRKEIKLDTSINIPRVIDVSSDKFVCSKLQIQILQSANKNEDGTIKYKKDTNGNDVIDESNDHAFKLLGIMANVEHNDYQQMMTSP